MRSLSVFLVVMVALAHLAHAQSREVTVKVSFGQPMGLMEIDRMSLGQGGLSDQPMWESRVAEVRALRPRLIRLFVQEYFQLLRAPGRTHFESLDRSVEAILK